MLTKKPPIRPHEISFALGQIHGAIVLGTTSQAIHLVLELQQRIAELAESKGDAPEE
jgi:hypothetical protein